MDFYIIKERSTKRGTVEVYPDFQVTRSKDLMVRGRGFYAVWDEAAGLWSTDEYDVRRLVDDDLRAYKEKIASRTEGSIQLKLMGDFGSKTWLEFRSYVGHISDNSKQLDERLAFANTEIHKTDYVSRRLPYPLEAGPCEAYNEIIGTLYDDEERAKLEWAIGAVVAGDAKNIQKFVVLYGDPGGGKGTIINIIQQLFVGYYTAFEAKSLASASNAFSTEVFRGNPLVAIQHDGDLSRIEDNTKLNSIISHEDMTMNEKFKPSYMARINAFLFMGTNKPVRISDAKSGIIRRLIDVKPSGRHIPGRRYQALMSQIDFELGGIATHCLEVYRKMGKDYYAGYRPLNMIMHTDVFFNFIEASYDVFKEQNGATLQQAYDMYKRYCDDSNVEFKLPRHKFREEFKNYFQEFQDRARVDGEQVRSYYSIFLTAKFKPTVKRDDSMASLVMDTHISGFDGFCADRPAQYAGVNETPLVRWTEVTTTLADLDTTRLHYVKPPLDHIVIDFDLKDDNGEKSAELNLAAASNWPPTYAEYSKGGGGIHLHYIYGGDVADLSRVFSDGIEVKVFTGDASLRRKLTRCNNVPIATINSGLPLKEKKVINQDTVKSERALRDLIGRNLRKEIHPSTKPSVDFIHQILKDAYSSGLPYDVTDLRPKVLAFANGSSHQPGLCLKAVAEMKFHSEEPSQDKGGYDSDEIVLFDVEVFPNLFIVCWKFRGKDRQVVRMINPTAKDIEPLLKLKLVGFNNRRYDNHILYARYIGYTLEQLYMLSQAIISKSPSAMFGEAYNLSYADVYDYMSQKKSLKRAQLDLGIRHKELGLPWDQPVPDDLIELVCEYCDNDVISLEAVFEDCVQDFVARQILADLSGLTVNDTTQKHTAKIVFEGNKKASQEFVYTDLSTIFPGYKYHFGKSSYRDEDPGEGGYVYAEPGMYTNVALLDVASMHPTSIDLLNLFGPYTKNFTQLTAARVAIKHKEYDKAKGMLGGMLTKYLGSEEESEALSYALKIVINIVYGLTSAKFDNAFRDLRNVDNIVAKRGALFMIDLKHAVQERGFTVAHIKTDSIKIPNATPEIISFVMDFGKQYGYTFEHEATYSKFCLVNDAVYIAQVGWAEKAKKIGTWEATGAQFAHPAVFKPFFSREKLEFNDLCETKTVTTALYLDTNEGLPEGEHNYQFVGRAGAFCPVVPGAGGGLLLREKDGAYHAASGTKGYRWLEAEVVKTLDRQDDIDMGYFTALQNAAIETISKFGDFEWFVADDSKEHDNG